MFGMFDVGGRGVVTAAQVRPSQPDNRLSSPLSPSTVRHLCASHPLRLASPVSPAQTSEAVKVLTGVEGDERLQEDPGRQIKREEFTQHTRVALASQLGPVAVAPSR